jgi:starch synthase
MRIAMVSAECEPFAKTGGLADVVDALARALGELGHEVDVYLPRYRGLEPPAGADRLRLSVPVGAPPGRSRSGSPSARPADVELLTGAANGYRIRLVDHAPSFDRPSYYGEEGDYPDNAARFSLLGRTALTAIEAEARPVAVLHGHDWQACPAILQLLAERVPAARPGTLLTCHNLAYHGWLPRSSTWQLGLAGEPGDGAGELGDTAGVDLLREGVRRADLVNTVSPTYARESLSPEYGGGLDDVLRSRGDRYLGILNGLDTRLWDPATDAALPARYDASDLSGKRACRLDLCARHGLDGDGPIFGLVGRLDPQKGFDLLTAAAPAMLAAGSRLIVLGTGDHRLVAGLQALAAGHQDRLVVIDRFDRDEARRIYAGVDAFLMPSRFEPSGQGQMIALRYGTLPVVRRTGGLADTVVDADLDPQHGNGFCFGPADPEALLDAASRAAAAYADAPRWAQLVRRGMAIDFSWRRPAESYVTAYERAIELARD